VASEPARTVFPSEMLMRVLTALAAGVSSPLGPFLVVASGFVIAAFGHIIKSRLLILLGLVIIAGVSAYVSFVQQPGS
jgi:hypothetical protein